MKRAVVFVFIACCAVSALSLAENEKRRKPSATVSPAGEFGASSPNPIITAKSTTESTTAATTTTTEAPKPTTTKPAPKPTTTPAPKPTTKPTPKPTTTPAPKPTTTKPAPKPTTTTPAPKPTTTKPAPKPTTTKPAPKPTTKPAPKPTTKPAPKPTTTTPPKPTTKPTPKPTPTPPKPTPAVNLTTGTYNLTQEKKVCLMAQMAVQIRLVTPKANGTFIIQPKDTEARGFCQSTKANLTLVFKEGYITFMFNKSTAENTAYVNDLSFQLAYPLVKDGTVYRGQNKSVHLFAARIGRSYSCKTESFHMGNGLYLDFKQDRVQGFNVTANEFGATDFCPADQPDYRVAIAVGVTLLVLIVIVVIAYLLGRKKRADGYQSL
ncbi:macrosialin-like isoform X2 [Scomber scombrus]|uniref:macrosialin-like isoform X2 n=1 Tax=Scomber scombrus TaxID=13677 RepID=UPI002DD9803E|nr:macrosialin-like isoform X2 [Scomber scombrus]